MKKKRTKKQQMYWEQMKEYVEKNGIYPVRCGMPIYKFCKHFGIDVETYRDWMEKEEYAEFSEMIRTANEVFSQQLGELMENSLIKLVTGYEEWEEMHEGMPDGQGGVIIKKMTRKKKIIPPSLGAITYLQCNMFPDRWTNPQKFVACLEGRVDSISMSAEDYKRIIGKMRDAIKDKGK